MNKLQSELVSNQIHFSVSIENICTLCGFPLDSIEESNSQNALKISVGLCKNCSGELKRDIYGLISSMKSYIGDQQTKEDVMSNIKTLERTSEKYFK